MRDFTEGSILKQLVYFTIPMLLANLLQAMYSVIDGIFVGRLIGHEAYAAVASTNPMIFLLVSAIIGMTISTNILIAQAFGAKNMTYLSKVLTNSFLTSLLLCIVLSVTGISLTNTLLNLINTPPNIRANARLFFTVFISGLTFNFMYNWFSAILRGLGDSKTPLSTC